MAGVGVTRDNPMARRIIAVDFFADPGEPSARAHVALRSDFRAERRDRAEKRGVLSSGENFCPNFCPPQPT
jgi:hypothetical protein